MGAVSQGNGDQVGMTKRWGLSEAPFLEITGGTGRHANAKAKGSVSMEAHF
jgi:hypothetical protein